MSEPKKIDPARVGYFYAFIRCGGVITLDEWRKLDEEAIEAFVVAAEKADLERARKLAEAQMILAIGARRDAILERMARANVTRRSG